MALIVVIISVKGLSADSMEGNLPSEEHPAYGSEIHYKEWIVQCPHFITSWPSRKYVSSSQKRNIAWIRP